jgi:hypothetical protein
MSDEQAPAPPRQLPAGHVEIPVKPGNSADAYGQPLAPQRRQELQDLLDAWNAPDADHGERRGPFDSAPLTGADVPWLAYGGIQNLLEGASLRGA